jgi:hypothetical protein
VRKIIFLLSLIAHVLLLSSEQLRAQQPTSYLCEVVASYRISGDALQNIRTSRYKGNAYGQRFQINIKSGAMVGEVFTSRHWARTTILDDGLSPRGSSFKVLYSSPPGSEFINVAWLQVHVSESANRPFIFLDDDEAFTGVCRYAS